MVDKREREDVDALSQGKPNKIKKITMGPTDVDPILFVDATGKEYPYLNLNEAKNIVTRFYFNPLLVDRMDQKPQILKQQPMYFPSRMQHASEQLRILIELLNELTKSADTTAILTSAENTVDIEKRQHRMENHALLSDLYRQRQDHILHRMSIFVKGAKRISDRIERAKVFSQELYNLQRFYSLQQLKGGLYLDLAINRPNAAFNHCYVLLKQQQQGFGFLYFANCVYGHQYITLTKQDDIAAAQQSFLMQACFQQIYDCFCRNDTKLHIIHRIPHRSIRIRITPRHYLTINLVPHPDTGFFDLQVESDDEQDMLTVLFKDAFLEACKKRRASIKHLHIFHIERQLPKSIQQEEDCLILNVVAFLRHSYFVSHFLTESRGDFFFEPLDFEYPSRSIFKDDQFGETVILENGFVIIHGKPYRIEKALMYLKHTLPTKVDCLVNPNVVSTEI
mmetsp:Transcript_11147/g.16455  ORF Transcript_11147/g.16455 Transcript_11147/m.16455 type:complete len:451 (+) Transcript_11147:57-1409(+)